MKKLSLIILLFLFSCDNKISDKVDIDICKTFYEKNKNKDISVFYGINISSIRTDEDTNGRKYAIVNGITLYDSTTADYDYIYASRYTKGWENFLKNDTAKYLYIYQKRFNSKESIKLHCLEYAMRILNQYYDLEVPEPYFCKGIYSVVSNPKNGYFISFHLTKYHHLYYVPQLNKVYKTEWKDYFTKLQQFDSNWYYYIGENEK